MVKKTLLDIHNIIEKLSYKDWMFHIGYDGGSDLYLQIQFYGSDTSGQLCEIPQLQKCRKWRLSFYMTESEIVRTAWKAVLAAEEHEASELFMYEGVDIYNPHIDVKALKEAMVSKKIDIR